MPRRPATRPSPKQQEILDLMEEQPEITAKEIAAELQSTENAVYQQISRLRTLKLLPKAKKRGRPHLNNGSKQSGASHEIAIVSNNGKLPSIEDHVAGELFEVEDRIDRIKDERAAGERTLAELVAALDGEESELTIRHTRLTNARDALVGEGTHVG